MIINTGQRTDIPAFYAEWFANRLREGYVCVRNPYNPKQVSKYQLNSEVVDVIGFCTKNPAPMFPYMDLLKEYGQYWFVTITPYGKDIEPNVPDKHQLLRAFRQLSELVGTDAIAWRYDPIFLNDRYTVEYHLRAFEKMAAELEGYTSTVVISFIDLYQKVKRNFPKVRQVDEDNKRLLGKELIERAGRHRMVVKPCAEGTMLAEVGADCSGCMTVATYEKAIHKKLIVPPKKPNRTECACYLACDIGAYDTCGHLCRYCYANNEIEMVKKNLSAHDPNSPFLIGNYMEGDVIHEVEQRSWIDPQISIYDIAPAKAMGMGTIWIKQGFGGLWNLAEEIEKPDKIVYHLSERKEL